MPDPNEQSALAERMAAVAAEARGEPAPPSPKPPEFQSYADALAAVNEAPAVAPMQPGVGTTFVETPQEPAPLPTMEPVAEVAPEPEPIRVATPTPEPVRRSFNSTPTPPEQPKPEIMEPERAADGTQAPYAASTLGEVVNMLERGAFSAEVVQALAALGKGMSEIADATGKRQKGTLTIKLSLTTEGDAFFVEADYGVKAPKLPRPRTLTWQTDDGRLTPSQPKQKLLFGVAGTEHGERNVRTLEEARVVRTL